MVLLLFIYFVLIFCGEFVLDPRFVMKYFVTFLVLQSSCCGMEICLLYFYCLLVMWYTCSWSLHRGAMGLSVCVIVAFPVHTDML